MKKKSAEVEVHEELGRQRCCLRNIEKLSGLLDLALNAVGILKEAFRFETRAPIDWYK